MIILFHKPYGILSQFTPQAPSQRTLAEFSFPRHVYPIGRLDKDSEGMLLLSDEPQWNDRLLNPRQAHPRTYHVQVEGAVDHAALQVLARGVKIPSGQTRPCQAELLPDPGYAPRNPPVRYRKNIPTSWICLTLTEGKNRQVRHMTAAVGFPTLRLIRVAMGGLMMKNLPLGQWRMLSDADIRMLLKPVRLV